MEIGENASNAKRSYDKGCEEAKAWAVRVRRASGRGKGRAAASKRKTWMGGESARSEGDRMENFPEESDLLEVSSISVEWKRGSGERGGLWVEKR